MNVTIKEFQQAFGGNMTLAAEALGVTRQNIYVWQRKGDSIPDPWNYKAWFLINTRQEKAPS